MSYNILVIEPNDFSLEALNLNDIPNLKTNIRRALPNYVTLKETNIQNMVEDLYNILNLNEDLIADTEEILETVNNVYQLCHVNYSNTSIPTTNFTTTSSNSNNIVNSLASYLCLTTTVYNTAIILNSRVTDNLTCMPDTLNLESLVDILYKKLIHQAVKITPSSIYYTISFYRSPIENLVETIEDQTQYKILEVSDFYKFNLLLYLQIKPINKHLNKDATKLLGTSKLYGDIIVVSKTAENEYIDLDVETLQKLVDLATDTLSSRKLTDEELRKNEKINNLPVVLTKYNLVNIKYRVNNNRYICTGCYRLRYPDITTQRLDWDAHKKDCLYNKPTLQDLS